MISKGKQSNVTVEDITSVVSEAQILGYYLGITNIPCIIKSPLRLDRNPSFGIHSRDGIHVYYKDFSTQEYGGTFFLLTQLFQLGMEDTIVKVYNDLIKDKKKGADVKIGQMSDQGRVSYSKDVDLQVKVREWKQHDIEYWEQYGISLPWLKFSKTYPISHIIITRKEGTFTITAEKYAYVYVEYKDSIPSLKIYQPYSETFKWTNKHDGSVWDLWQQLPESGDDLIITKSRKDALCIWENTGIPACSLQAESYLPKEHVVQELKDRFKRVHVLYDNDFSKETNIGRIAGENLSKQFGLHQIEMPDSLKIKDTSDLCKREGRAKVKEIINSLIF